MAPNVFAPAALQHVASQAMQRPSYRPRRCRSAGALDVAGCTCPEYSPERWSERSPSRRDAPLGWLAVCCCVGLLAASRRLLRRRRVMDQARQGKEKHGSQEAATKHNQLLFSMPDLPSLLLLSHGHVLLRIRTVSASADSVGSEGCDAALPQNPHCQTGLSRSIVLVAVHASPFSGSVLPCSAGDGGVKGRRTSIGRSPGRPAQSGGKASPSIA